MADLISLKEFRSQIERADFDDHAETLERSIHRIRAAATHLADAGRGSAPIPGPTGNSTVSASTVASQEFEGMKDFLVRLYEGTSCGHTFLDASGNPIDCLPFEHQPTVRAARKKGIDPKRKLPPPPPLDHAAEFDIDSMDSGPRPTGLVAPLRQGKVDLYGNKVAAPSGTVPFRRLTLARLAQLGGLERHFRKTPPPVRDPRPVFHRKSGRKSATTPAAADAAIIPATTNTANAHRYAVYQFGPFQQSGVLSGISSFLNVWNPNPAPGAMSLSQQWIVGPTTATGHPQTIESGWQIQPLFGAQTVFFVYFNPDGYSTNSGYVYNQHMEGFIAADGCELGARRRARPDQLARRYSVRLPDGLATGRSRRLESLHGHIRKQLERCWVLSQGVLCLGTGQWRQLDSIRRRGGPSERLFPDRPDG